MDVGWDKAMRNGAAEPLTERKRPLIFYHGSRFARHPSGSIA